MREKLQGAVDVVAIGVQALLRRGCHAAAVIVACCSRRGRRMTSMLGCAMTVTAVFHDHYCMRRACGEYFEGLLQRFEWVWGVGGGGGTENM